MLTKPQKIAILLSLSLILVMTFINWINVNNMSKLTISTIHYEGDIYLDNKNLQHLNIRPGNPAILDLKSGTYEIKAEAPDFLPFKKVIVLKKKDVKKIEIKMDLLWEECYVD